MKLDIETRKLPKGYLVNCDGFACKQSPDNDNKFICGRKVGSYSLSTFLFFFIFIFFFAKMFLFSTNEKKQTNTHSHTHTHTHTHTHQKKWQ